MATRSMDAPREKQLFAEVKSFALTLFSKMGQDNIPRLASSFSFFALLSVAPFLVLSVTVAALVFGKSHAADRLLHQVADIGGPQVRDYVNTVIQSSQQKSATAIATVLSLVVTFFSASNLFLQLDLAVNSIWGINTEGTFVRNYIVTRVVAFFSVLLFGGLLLGWLVLDSVVGWIAHHSDQHNAYMTLSFLSSVVFLTFGFSITIRALPRGKLKWKDALLGGLVTALGVSISKFLLTFYFARIGGVYGAAGSVVILLLWMYYTSMIYFFGIEVTYAYSHRYGSLKGQHEPFPCLVPAKDGLQAS
jgi:membrane protein